MDMDLENVQDQGCGCRRHEKGVAMADSSLEPGGDSLSVGLS